MSLAGVLNREQPKETQMTYAQMDTYLSLA
jgi:hypothetical protein